MSEEGKTPTIEQKSTFSSKTKEGSDVEFVAILKFYINPAGNVRIETPGSKQHPEDGGHDSQVGAPPVDTGVPTVKDEKHDKKGSVDVDPTHQQVTGPNVTKKTGETPSTGGGKQIPKSQGDCAINQFIPDPCRAIDDLTKSIKGFFSGSSGKCPPCPSEASNFGPTPKPKQLTGGGLDQIKNEAGSEMMEKEEKYEV